MDQHFREALRRRQANWDAFHRWESRRAVENISFEDRIAWYAAAYDFSRQFSTVVNASEIEDKVQYLSMVRRRLAHLG